MTPEERALLDAVIAEPHRDEPRLAYSKWLEQQSPPDLRGEFIRLAVRYARDTLAAQADLKAKQALLEDRARFAELRQDHEGEWQLPVLQIASSCELERGLVASVTLPAETFLARGEELMQLAPIVHVALTAVRGLVPQLAACPALGNVRALSLAGQGLTGRDMAVLGASDKVSKLWWLDLVTNDIDLNGIRAMARAPYFASLRHVELAGNPGDVHERAGTEGYVVSRVWFPPEGRELEEELGYIPWLHYHPATFSNFPPDPCGPPP